MKKYYSIFRLPTWHLLMCFQYCTIANLETIAYVCGTKRNIFFRILVFGKSKHAPVGRHYIEISI